MFVKEKTDSFMLLQSSANINEKKILQL